MIFSITYQDGSVVVVLIAIQDVILQYSLKKDVKVAPRPAKVCNVDFFLDSSRCQGAENSVTLLPNFEPALLSQLPKLSLEHKLVERNKDVDLEKGISEEWNVMEGRKRNWNEQNVVPERKKGNWKR